MLAAEIRAGKAASERSESPRVRRWLDDTITVQRKSGVLPDSLRFEPRLAQQLRYPLRPTTEIPNIEIHHLETLSEASVTGAKGVGEGGTIGAPITVSPRASPTRSMKR